MYFQALETFFSSFAWVWSVSNSLTHPLGGEGWKLENKQTNKQKKKNKKKQKHNFITQLHHNTHIFFYLFLHFSSFFHNKHTHTHTQTKITHSLETIPRRSGQTLRLRALHGLCTSHPCLLRGRKRIFFLLVNIIMIAHAHEAHKERKRKTFTNLDLKCTRSLPLARSFHLQRPRCTP